MALSKACSGLGISCHHLNVLFCKQNVKYSNLLWICHQPTVKSKIQQGFPREGISLDDELWQREQQMLQHLQLTRLESISILLVWGGGMDVCVMLILIQLEYSMSMFQVVWV